MNVTTIQALSGFPPMSVTLSPSLSWATRNQMGRSFRVKAQSAFLTSQTTKPQRTFRQCGGTWVLLQDTAFADSSMPTGSSPTVATDPEHRRHPVLLKLWLSYLRTWYKGWLPSVCLLQERLQDICPRSKVLGLKTDIHQNIIKIYLVMLGM